MKSKNVDYDGLLELQEAWAPEDPALQEFLRYTRDRR